MASLDPAQQWHELTENYSDMSDDELCRLAEDASDLVPLAQEALQAVIAQRGLKVSTTDSHATQSDQVEADEDTNQDKLDPRYLETRDAYELITVRTVYSEEEAALVKSILDETFIASCIGPDDVVELSEFTGNFADGVELKIHHQDGIRAHQALDLFAPLSETKEEIESENKEYAIICPKCHSQEVIFEGNDPGETGETTTGKFNWTCGDCGHQWKDDGVEEVI